MYVSHVYIYRDGACALLADGAMHGLRGSISQSPCDEIQKYIASVDSTHNCASTYGSYADNIGRDFTFRPTRGNQTRTSLGGYKNMAHSSAS